MKGECSNKLNEVYFYHNKMLYRDGWYIYVNENGKNSILTREAAHKIERDYQHSQARMDIDRGGMDDTDAFQFRGFKREGYDYVYVAPYKTDLLSTPENDVKITSDLIIPSNIDNIEINCIYSNSFSNLTEIKTVTLPSTIKYIEYDAFRDCTFLQTVNLSNYDVSISDGAFDGTNALENIDGVLYIGRILVKANSDLTGEYKIKDGTVSIADNAFEKCKNLSKVIIPQSVKNVGMGVFFECSSLEEVIMNSKLNALKGSVFYGCENLKSIVIPEGVTRIERGTFEGCKELSQISLPSTITSIGFDSFRNTKIMNDFLYGNENVLYINNWLITFKEDFNGILDIKEGTIGLADVSNICGSPKKVSKIIIPSSVKYLGMGCFEKCSEILDIDIPNSVEVIGQSSFRGCSKLKHITFPASLETIEKWNIMDCSSIETVTFLNPNTKIEWPAIVGRHDKKEIKIMSYNNSTAEKYCIEFGYKENLKFRTYNKNSFHNFLSKLF